MDGWDLQLNGWLCFRPYYPITAIRLLNERRLRRAKVRSTSRCLHKRTTPLESWKNKLTGFQ